jgi:hypothetical protein
MDWVGMSNAEDSSGSGRSGHDPVTGFLLAVRDAWLAGIAPKENVGGPTMPGGNPGAASAAATLLQPMIGMLGAMVDMAAPNRQRFDQPGDSAPHSAPDGQHDPVAADLLQPMGHAMMIAANRSVSYWLGLARIFESHRASLLQAAMEPTEQNSATAASLVSADELRALLREVGDLATREARILQNELSVLDDNLAQSFQQPDQSGAYRRRWRSKV